MKRNGWEKARALVSAYLFKNPTIKNTSDLLMSARKFLAGYTGTDVSLSVMYFEKYLANNVIDSLSLGTSAEMTFPDTSSIQPDILIVLSQFASRVGFEKLDEHVQVVKSIRSL